MAVLFELVSQLGTTLSRDVAVDENVNVAEAMLGAGCGCSA